MGVRGVSGNLRSSRVKGEHLPGPGNSATRCLQLQGVKRMEVQIWERKTPRDDQIMGLGVYRFSGMMEKKMKTTTIHWGYIGIMEKKMETILVFF